MTGRGWDLGIREVSGLALRRDPRSGRPEVIAVGDRTTSVARLGTDGEGRLQRDARHDRVTGLPGDLDGGPDGSQWEGVAADATGRVIVLRERGSELLVLSPDLGFERRIQLRHRWQDERRSGLEALLLMRRGHILAAKQLQPVRLLEFGPAGDEPLGLTPDAFLPAGEPTAFAPAPELHCLATWRIADDALSSVNDMSAHAGRLYLISSAARRIGWVELPAGEAVRVGGWWPLPDEVAAGRGERAEGLLVDDRLGVLVGVDAHRKGVNLHRLVH